MKPHRRKERVKSTKSGAPKSNFLRVGVVSFLSAVIALIFVVGMKAVEQINIWIYFFLECAFRS
jgi:hypothetical protein